MASAWTHALEWRIAWRHLRVGDRHPRWVDALTYTSLFVLAVGIGFVLWAAHLGPAPEPGEQLFSATVASALQRQFGVFGGLSLAIGTMLLVLAVLARFFNLLATIITMSVLLGCMALVVVLSLMSGLEADLRDKILNQKAHLRVSARDGNRFTDYEALTEALMQVPEVAGASPYLEAEVMVRSGINRQGAVLIGVQPDRLLQVSNIADIVREGSFDALVHPESIPEPDPFALAETPYRLRHLEKDKPSVRTKIDKLVPRPEDRAEVERDPPRPLPDIEELGEPPKPIPGLNANPPPPSKSGINLPPPPELFGPNSLPGFAGPPDDGWEDPVEVLGLDEQPATQPEPSEQPEPKPEEEEWEEEGGWEDPVEVLNLPPAQPGDGDAIVKETAPPEIDPIEHSPPPREGVVDPILIGRELANELAVGVGARVQLITPVGRLTPAGRVPGILASRVGGVFHSGMYEYDRKNVYMPLPVAQAFLRTGDRVSGIEVKLHDIDQVDAGKAAVEAALLRLGRSTPSLERVFGQALGLVSDPQLRAEIAERSGIRPAESELIVESWKELNRNLFSAMFLEKIAMFVALLFVVLVASFGILASNLMSVLEKSKEIAILKAMGAPDHLIQRVFVAEGLVLGLLGAIGGITLGLALCLSLDRFGFPFNENVYYIERLPVVVNPFEVAVVGFAALVIVFLSSLYPARVASRMRPIDGLRHQEK
ncbi:MAG TPA: FtsX-like permease family protein [Enhygromyxa sp.]|nr:FtsX-like permease family protein [Enhygromyxa sp.]